MARCQATKKRGGDGYNCRKRVRPGERYCPMHGGADDRRDHTGRGGGRELLVIALVLLVALVAVAGAIAAFLT